MTIEELKERLDKLEEELKDICYNLEFINEYIDRLIGDGK